MKPALDQQAAIDHRDSSLLLSASAGSGKTEVLARRCVSLLVDRERHVDITRLLVLTFTRAAAAELRTRIGRSLRAELEKTPDGALRDRIARQIALLDSAEIGTIDSWCQRLVREHSAQLGVDPQFATLSEHEHLILRRAGLDALFETIYRADDEVAAAARDWIGRSIEASDRALREMVDRLNVYREHLIDPERWFAAQRAAAGASENAARADATRQIVDEIARECREQVEELATIRNCDGIAEYREMLSGVLTRVKSGEEVGVICNDIARHRWPRKANGSAPDVLREQIKKIWHGRRLRELFDPRAIEHMIADQPAVNARIAVLIDLESRFAAQLWRLKHARNAYAFADIQRLALRLLKDDAAGELQPSTLSLALREHYEHVLIDECQDTSAVQMALLRLVTRSHSPRTNCFMVGDVKQSIYGFRQANPRLFAEIMRDFDRDPRTGKLLHLTSSFRSHALLLEALNRLFEPLFDDSFGGTTYASHEQLRAERDEIDNSALDGRSRISVYLLTVGGDAKQATTDTSADETDDDRADPDSVDAEDDRMEREARFIARQIKSALPATMIPDRDGAGRLALRPARLSDFAILLRSAKANAVKVATTLREEGVNAATVGREDFIDTTEGHDLLAALRVIVNPAQDLALAAYLRSPLAGLGERCLLEIRRTCAAGDFYSACRAYRSSGSNPEFREQIDAALCQLEAWVRAARDEDVAKLADRVLRDTQYELFCLGTSLDHPRIAPRGPRRVATLTALREFIRAFASGPHGDVASFVAFVDQLEELDEFPQSTVLAGDDAVRIMTIHQAKGLEFPIVVLAGAGARFNDVSSRSALLCDENVGIALREIDYTRRREVISAAHRVAARRRRAHDREEELRLLYVAATRAREALWIVGHGKAEFPATPAPIGTKVAISGYARVNAGTMLDWVRMSLTRIESDSIDRLFAVKTHDLSGPQAGAAEPLAAEQTVLSRRDDDADHREWIDSAVRSITLPLANSKPAVISVSELKSLARAAPDEERATPLDDFEPELARPAFATKSAPDGRLLGIAVHRFFQHADLTLIATADDVTRELNRLAVAGVMAVDEAALVDPADIAWLGQSVLGRLLSAHSARLRREVPFVLLLEDDAVLGTRRWEDALLTRGVIDCLIDLPDRVILVDYKTDRIRDEEIWQARIAAYGAQLSVYAEAIRRIFDKPVEQAWLAFISERRVEQATLSLKFISRIG
ncbi:MAG: UvrD-helicase domain-containing protein [Phycisphaerales bacterium]|nr:UvrD-helicase domain-containing protein [Phycisphaerales bacterium]